jgi:hypothetical protein
MNKNLSFFSALGGSARTIRCNGNEEPDMSGLLIIRCDTFGRQSGNGPVIEDPRGHVLMRQVDRGLSHGH